MKFGLVNTKKGFSLIEVVIVIAILGMTFAGLFAGFEFSLKLIAHSRAKMSAISLATDRSEYIRSLPYVSIGTVAGIPNGAIPQNRLVTLNGIDFNERVLIEYVDDPADGVGVADSNGVQADYKRFKIEYSWTIYGSTQSFSLISSASPRSIETLAGGGTIRVNVTDAAANPLPGASVRLVNTTGTTSIDVTRSTDATGQALFTGAPAQSGYMVYVFGLGYSSDQTRAVTPALAFPLSQPFSLLDADVSTLNFQIDRVSDLAFKFYTGETVADNVELFDDLLGTIASSSVTASSGSLRLSGSVGSYAPFGSVMTDAVSPGTLEAWGVVKIDKTVPVGTDVRVRVYSTASTTSLLSDSTLPGNTSGFTADYISLVGIDATTFPELYFGIELSTSNTNFTPAVGEFAVEYATARTPLANNDFTLRGTKVIGADAAAQNVYKFNEATSTDATGELNLSDIEWDTYVIELGEGYDVAEACPNLPYYLEPDVNKEVSIKATVGGANNLRIMAIRSDGAPVIGASVELDDTAGSVVTGEAGWCGQVFFPGLNNTIGYTINVGAPGFATTTLSAFSVSGATYQEVILLP